MLLNSPHPLACLHPQQRKSNNNKWKHALSCLRQFEYGNGAWRQTFPPFLQFEFLIPSPRPPVASPPHFPFHSHSVKFQARPEIMKKFFKLFAFEMWHICRVPFNLCATCWTAKDSQQLHTSNSLPSLRPPFKAAMSCAFYSYSDGLEVCLQILKPLLGIFQHCRRSIWKKYIHISNSHPSECFFFFLWGLTCWSADQAFRQSVGQSVSHVKEFSIKDSFRAMFSKVVGINAHQSDSQSFCQQCERVFNQPVN